jgi:hypothetical protein
MAELVDGVAWEQVAAILPEPSLIAREVERYREDVRLDRDLVAVEARLAGIAKK